MARRVDWSESASSKFHLGFKAIVVFAAVTHFLFALQQLFLTLYVGAQRGWGFVLDRISSGVFVLFYFVLSLMFFDIYLYEPQLRVSRPLRWVALGAFIFVGSQNATSIIGLTPWVLHEARDGFAWHWFPVRHTLDILSGSLPPLTTAAMLAFLAGIYSRRVRSAGYQNRAGDIKGVRILRRVTLAVALAALLNWVAGLVLMLTNPNRTSPSIFALLLSLAGPVSLTLFLIIMADAQRSKPAPLGFT